MNKSAQGSIDGIVLAPFGALAIRVQGDRLTAIEFGNQRKSRQPESAIGRRAARALQAYLEDPDCRPGDWFPDTGTEFQRRVWRQVRRIPNGSTRTYGKIAERLDSGPRAVGNACRVNPLPLLVPCHRIVSAAGMGGYAGAVDGRIHRIKRWLLCHEGIEI